MHGDCTTDRLTRIKTVCFLSLLFRVFLFQYCRFSFSLLVVALSCLFLCSYLLLMLCVFVCDRLEAELVQTRKAMEEINRQQGGTDRAALPLSNLSTQWYLHHNNYALCLCVCVCARVLCLSLTLHCPCVGMSSLRRTQNCPAYCSACKPGGTTGTELGPAAAAATAATRGCDAGVEMINDRKRLTNFVL